MSDLNDQKLFQIRDIILGSEVKNVADNLENRTQSLSDEIAQLGDSFAGSVKKINSRIEEEKLLLINSIDYLKTEIDDLKKKLNEEVRKNQELIEKNRVATVSKVSFSKILQEMAGHLKSEESSSSEEASELSN